MKSALILVIILTIFNSETIACSCIGKSTVESGLKNSSIVAVGTVLNMTTVEVADSDFYYLLYNPNVKTNSNGGYMIKTAKYTIIVESLIKGQISSDTISILTGLWHGACGFNFTIGQKYIIYGDDKSYLGNEKKHDHLSNSNTFWTVSTR